MREQWPIAKTKLKWLFPELYSANQTASGLEDPSMWVDSNGRYHALMRESFNSCDGAGCVAPRSNLGHAWSHDGLHWNYTGQVFPMKDYGSSSMPQVYFTDGTSVGNTCENESS